VQIDHGGNNYMTRDPMTPKQMAFQDSCWNIYVSSLAIGDPSSIDFWDNARKNRQTHRWNFNPRDYPIN